MTDDNEINLNAEELRQKLNLETGKIDWQELQRSFARGVVIVAEKSLDLIDVAVALSADDKEQFEEWVSNDKVWRATDSDAKNWHQSSQLFWSVVIPPWVLVQEINE